jgi:hypothetical protein
VSAWTCRAGWSRNVSRDCIRLIVLEYNWTLNLFPTSRNSAEPDRRAFYNVCSST